MGIVPAAQSRCAIYSMGISFPGQAEHYQIQLASCVYSKMLTKLQKINYKTQTQGEEHMYQGLIPWDFLEGNQAATSEAEY